MTIHVGWRERIARAWEALMVFVTYPYWVLLVLAEEEVDPVNSRPAP